MRKILLVAVSVFMMGMPQKAAADEAYSFTTGNILHDWCFEPYAQANNVQYTIYKSFCEGYIMGSFQTIWAASAVKGLKPEECLPSTVTNGQIADIVKSYLKNHPEKRHTMALLLVGQSLDEAFPGCLQL